MFAVFDDVVSLQECQILKNKIESWYLRCLDENAEKNLWKWENRILDITPRNMKANHLTKYNTTFYSSPDLQKLQEDICHKVINLLQNRLNIGLTLDCVELQTWPMNSDGPAHKHEDPANGRGHNDYNSLLYLNDDFDGGEFYTENGIIVRPKPGRLTFFDGAKTFHGVSEIYNANRFTMIFWWKNTKFK